MPEFDLHKLDPARIGDLLESFAASHNAVGKAMQVTLGEENLHPFVTMTMLKHYVTGTLDGLLEIGVVPAHLRKEGDALIHSMVEDDIKKFVDGLVEILSPFYKNDK